MYGARFTQFTAQTIATTTITTSTALTSLRPDGLAAGKKRGKGGESAVCARNKRRRSCKKSSIENYETALLFRRRCVPRKKNFEAG